jgi:uncharacterized protein YgiM (DUF1202 family)
VKQIFFAGALIFYVAACSAQVESTPTPPSAITARELPTATPTVPPTATPIPTNTPLPTDTPIPTATYTPTVTPTITPTPECVGAAPTRLSVGGRARVINFQLNVRSGAGTQHSLVNRLTVDREVTIMDGPQCDEGQIWYYIISDEFINDAGDRIRVEGWSVEESDDVYYLEPID